ncbi:MAG: Rpn family recombination-promoting nuclease/putative transposase, partial [Candidatus Electrothrix sp. AR5]|nr:Rpn family recombination-promoting nuclease/putative transposase [Candidatus Electrothrix sp. AR5]
STFPIREQAERDDWNFKLKAVYTVAILDFVFDEDKNQPEKYRYDVKLTDVDTNRIFYDKLTFIYLEMPKFKKSLEDLETRFDKWLYVIKNLNRLERLPETLRGEVFEQLFDSAEIARFTPDQVRSYEKSLKYYRDLKNSLDTAFDEGKEEGVEIGKAANQRETVTRGLKQGLDKEVIAALTGLSVEAIEKIAEEVEINRVKLD